MKNIVKLSAVILLLASFNCAVGEVSSEEAASWWAEPNKPMTYIGVPGFLGTPAILWNASILVSPYPAIGFQNFDKETGAFRFGYSPLLGNELAGNESGMLQIEFSFGDEFFLPDRFDASAGHYSRAIVDGRLPAVIHTFLQGDVEWKCIVFCRMLSGAPTAVTGEEIMITDVQWTAKNLSDKDVKAQFNCHFNASHFNNGHPMRLMKKAARYFHRIDYKTRQKMVIDDRGIARLAVEAFENSEATFYVADEGIAKSQRHLVEAGLHRDILSFEIDLKAGKSSKLRLMIPFYAVKPKELKPVFASSFDEELERFKAFWNKELSGVKIPDRLVNDTVDSYLAGLMICTHRKPKAGFWMIKTSPLTYEGPWVGTNAACAYALDVLGKHVWSRRILDEFIDNQVTIPASISRNRMAKIAFNNPDDRSEGFSSHPGYLAHIPGSGAGLWGSDHGWCMWAIARHAWLTNDWDWFRKNADKMSLACEWIAEQRKRTMLYDENGQKRLSWGLLPARRSWDWGFGHIFWGEAVTYAGLRDIAECLKYIGHEKADEYIAEAENYRSDIITAATRGRNLAKPVPLADGTTIPYVPMGTELLDYAAPDWTYLACGPLYLGVHGVVDADHELIDQTFAVLEAGVPAENGNERLTPGADGEDRLYYWYHRLIVDEPGWTPHSHLYIQRDELDKLFEAYYSFVNGGGQYVDLRSEWEKRDNVPWVTWAKGHFTWVTRNLLLREKSDTLILAGSCPRAWLAKGKTLAVNALPTTFGKVSYKLDVSEDDAIKGKFDFDLYRQPEKIMLRLRRPGGILPKEVRINGKVVRQKAGEWIELTPATKTMLVKY